MPIGSALRAAFSGRGLSGESNVIFRLDSARSYLAFEVSEEMLLRDGQNVA